ncbi:calcium-dependent secretion activator 1 isoform 1 [Cricetulus griseus]|nr:calcium-dependent secretion activator 1 isoform 1 [Cricetulus griseus]
MRCIAYPFNAKQPTDMARRQQKCGLPYELTVNDSKGSEHLLPGAPRKSSVYSSGNFYGRLYQTLSIF